MNPGNHYPHIAILIIIILLISTVTILPIRRTSYQEPFIDVYAEKKVNGDPGGIYFKTFDLWKETEIIFIDFRYDGTLDEIRIPYKDKKIDPNDLWIKRYNQARKWAASIEEPNI
jgi:hypothetical protein